MAVGQRWDEAAKHAGRCVKAVQQENRQGSFGLTSRKKAFSAVDGGVLIQGS